MKIKELLEDGRKKLIQQNEPYRLSKILLKYLLKVDDNYLVVHQDEDVEQNIEEEFYKKINLLEKGKPVQYITNHQEFMKMKFYVDENVLIPQPDTEILVEEILNICRKQSYCSLRNKRSYRILDLCAGSGAIGISLAQYIENTYVIMSDISDKALEISKKNAMQNKVEDKCEFIHSDMFENIDGKFDIIVSNPPYIKTEVIKTLDKQVQNEPVIALDGGEDGLEFYRTIIRQAYKHLNASGILALEIGYDQKQEVLKLLKEGGKYKNIYSKKDLSGNDRVVICNV